MKPSKLIPPDPRPSKAHPEHRSQRKAVEKEHGAGAFEWVSAVALLLAGMTILIDVEKDVKKCEERREREQRERERERERERDHNRHPRSHHNHNQQQCGGRRLDGNDYDEEDGRYEHYGDDDGYHGYYDRGERRRGGRGDESEYYRRHGSSSRARDEYSRHYR